MPLPKCKFGDAKYSAFMITGGPIPDEITRERAGECVSRFLPNINANPWQMSVAIESKLSDGDTDPYRHFHIVVGFERKTRFTPKLVEAVKKELCRSDGSRKPNCQGNYVPAGSIPKRSTGYAYLCRYIQDPKKMKVCDDGAIDFKPGPTVEQQMDSIWREAIECGQCPFYTQLLEMAARKLFYEMRDEPPAVVDSCKGKGNRTRWPSGHDLQKHEQKRLDELCELWAVEKRHIGATNALEARRVRELKRRFEERKAERVADLQRLGFARVIPAAGTTGLVRRPSGIAHVVGRVFAVGELRSWGMQVCPGVEDLPTTINIPFVFLEPTPQPEAGADGETECENTPPPTPRAQTAEADNESDETATSGLSATATPTDSDMHHAFWQWYDEKKLAAEKDENSK